MHSRMQGRNGFWHAYILTSRYRGRKHWHRAGSSGIDDRTDGNENGLNAHPVPVGFALPRDLDPSRSTSTLFGGVMPIRFQIAGFRSRRSANPTTLVPSSVLVAPGVPGVNNARSLDLCVPAQRRVVPGVMNVPAEPSYRVLVPRGFPARTLFRV